MKAFRLFAEVTRNGIDNTMMTEYRHSSERTLQDYFGKEYSVTGKCLEDGEELLAIWSDKDGNALIKGIADVILSNGKDKIYLYCIE